MPGAFYSLSFGLSGPRLPGWLEAGEAPSLAAATVQPVLLGAALPSSLFSPPILPVNSLRSRQAAALGGEMLGGGKVFGPASLRAERQSSRAPSAG